MRISSAYIHQQALLGMSLMQSQLANTQQQLNTGLRLTKPSDDPSGTAALLMIRKGIDTNNQYQSNSDAATISLSLEESILTSASDNINRAKELLIQANNDTLRDEQRKAIAVEMRQIRQGLMGLANTTDHTGDYIFSGHQSRTIPFILNVDGSVSYQGDQGEKKLQIGSSREVQVSDSGQDVFQSIRTGNGTFSVAADPANAGTATASAGSLNGVYVPDDYEIVFQQVSPTDPITYEVRDSLGNVVAADNYTSDSSIVFGGVSVPVRGIPADGDRLIVNQSRNQDIFTTLNNVISALETPVNTPNEQAKLRNALNGELSNLEQAREHIMKFVADVGARQNTVDSQREVNAALIMHATMTASSMQDLDYAKAISDFNRQTVGLQAAQQTYAKIQGLSLFNYLR